MPRCKVGNGPIADLAVPPAGRQLLTQFQTFEPTTVLLIETSSAGHVEVSFIVHFEFSSVNLDRFGDVIEQLFAHRWREHSDI